MTTTAFMLYYYGRLSWFARTWRGLVGVLVKCLAEAAAGIYQGDAPPAPYGIFTTGRLWKTAIFLSAFGTDEENSEIK